MKRYESNYNPAVKDISDYIHDRANDGRIHPDMVAKITNVLEGVEVMDNLITQKDQVIVQKDNVINQKTVEVQNKNSLLVQKEQLLGQKDNQLNQFQQIITTKTVELQSKENLLAQKDQILVQKEQKVGELQKTVFADSLHKLYPDSYSAKVEEWPDTLPMKKHVVNNNVYVMEKNTAIYKPLIEEKEKETIKKKFVKSLNELYPDSYSTDPNEWFYKDGRGPLPMKVHYDTNNIQVMVKNILYYKSEIKKNKNKELEEAKKLKEENLEKDQLLVQKDQLLLAKELENQKLLIQKEEEVHNKSLAKNQVIGELQEDIGLKEKDALNLKIESLMKQVEFHKKESEFKDKALEDALKIGKQNKIISKLKEKELADAHVINELQGKLLAFKDLSKHDETLQLELSVIHFKVEESISKGNIDEMKELSKYLSELMKNPIEKDESLDISELLNNLSPVVHGEENHIQNPLAVINNFDINHINTTHSVYPSGEVSESYEII